MALGCLYAPDGDIAWGSATLVNCKLTAERDEISAGIHTFAGTSLVTEDCHFTGNGLTAEDWDTSPNIVTSDGPCIIKATRCTFDGCRASGVSLDGEACSGEFVDCIIRGCCMEDDGSSAGLALEKATATWPGGSITGCATAGVCIDSGAQLTLFESRMLVCKTNGIIASEGPHPESFDDRQFGRFPIGATGIQRLGIRLDEIVKFKS